MHAKNIEYNIVFYNHNSVYLVRSPFNPRQSGLIAC